MSANLLENFALLAASEGGVAKLRELILSLAVRGKLVPQDPADEPASEFLKRIRAEKEQLATKSKITRENVLAVMGEGEKPFELPVGWEWVVFGEIAEIERGGSPRPIQAYLTNDANGLNWIKIGDTDIGGKYITAAKEKIRPDGLKKTRMVFPGDFLLTNSMSFGRPYITLIEGCIHDGWLRISPPSSLNKDYLYSLLSSQFIRQLFVSAAAGGVVLNLNADKVRGIPIPLPPLPEQSRIVAKVEALMALCDRLESQQGEAARVQAHWTQAALDQLAESGDADEFTRSWQALADHFDTLFATPASIDALDATLLQLAVRGKLVPQNPADEPASELLKHIRTEKDRLITAGQIKRDKPLPPIADDEKPFELPEGWEWARTYEVAESRLGKMLDKAKNTGSAYPYLRNTNVQWNRFDLEDVKEIYLEEHELDEFRLRPGDLLVCEGGEPGRCAIWKEEEEMYFQKALHRIRPLGGVLAKYLAICLETDAKAERLTAFFTGATIKHFAGQELNRYFFPLPPLPEQSRIVAKLDELLALTRTLRARLADARALQARLASALVEEVAA